MGEVYVFHLWLRHHAFQDLWNTFYKTSILPRQ
jgi:hypothetical protein